MRKSRKLMSILLVVAMLFTLAAPAMADDTTNNANNGKFTITIKNSAEGHTYEAYQIFKGDLSGKTLSNIEWGSGVSVTGQTALGNAAAKAETLTDSNVVAFSDEVAKYLTTTKFSTNTVTGGKYVIEGLEPGYYLVKDADKTLNGKDDAYTKYILEVVENSEVEPKSDVPEVVKKVKDTNDSTGTTSDWQDSADYDFGDAVPFQLKATLANNLESYKSTYKVVFHDTLSKGLTFDKITSVKIINADKSEIVLTTNNYSVATDSIADNTETTNMEEATKLTITIPDVKELGAKNSCQVIVEYTATLNNQANIGVAGNPNVVYLEYSNNPNWTGSGDNVPTGETPKDKVIVFTYKVVANKVEKNPNYDENDKDSKEYIALAGAGFTLFKKDATGTYQKIGEELTGVTTFEWKGLDDGDYKLVETTTPAGYNTIEDQYFTVTAEHDEEAVDPTLTSLSGNVTSGKVTFTANETAGSLSTDVVNNTGATLPETGGIGTTIFYVVGGALALGAAVLLVTRRRMAE